MPEEEKANVTNSDIYYRIGEMNGTLKTFIESQAKTNDVMFQKHRSTAFEQASQNTKISSLLQTRSNQWKMVTFLGGSAAGIFEAVKSFWPWH